MTFRGKRDGDGGFVILRKTQKLIFWTNLTKTRVWWILIENLLPCQMVPLATAPAALKCLNFAFFCDDIFGSFCICYRISCQPNVLQQNSFALMIVNFILYNFCSTKHFSCRRLGFFNFAFWLKIMQNWVLKLEKHFSQM